MIDDRDITLMSLFSYTQIESAVTFARFAQEIESKYQNSYSAISIPEKIQYKAFIVGAIKCAVGFLEAKINEFFSTINNKDRNRKKVLKPKVRKLISDMWEIGIPKTAKYRVLEKYQIALILAGKEKLIEGVAPFQDVNLLIQLRNAITHFEPEWVTTESDNPERITKQSLERKLSNKFTANPFALDIDPFFPDRCLSYHCAKWAILNVIEFTRQFYSSLGLEDPFAFYQDNAIFDLKLT